MGFLESVAKEDVATPVRHTVLRNLNLDSCGSQRLVFLSFITLISI